MKRRFRHNSPRLSSVSRCLGPTQVVTPFDHLSGDSHHHDPCSEQGPLPHLVRARWSLKRSSFERILRARMSGIRAQGSRQEPSRDRSQHAKEKVKPSGHRGRDCDEEKHLDQALAECRS
ncbi:hypothetical protein WN72_36060 [Bradyrhizobium arachidis]|uniref:Uncharacterized protein n=1 Tax=Bradyrhizobium arachidis TaxID=858423 RepID=A0AAE7NTM8_9BRAD|nr:hypothetical protein WN72_36060 [Bradyrhizobium arachidis]